MHIVSMHGAYIFEIGLSIIAHARERVRYIIYFVLYLHTRGLCKYCTGVRAKHANTFANIIRHCGTEPTVRSSAHCGKKINTHFTPSHKFPPLFLLLRLPLFAYLLYSFAPIGNSYSAQVSAANT